MSTAGQSNAKSWHHFVAGGLGGMCGAIVTSPFDVVKTRLQSSLFRESVQRTVTPSISLSGATGSGFAVQTARKPGLLWNFVETVHIIRDIYTKESPRGLFRGLGPTLVGVIPARSINFFVYGNSKPILASAFYGSAENNWKGKETPWVHLASAATAGIATGTATNPIWVVKTRLQLITDRAGDGVKSAGGVGGSLRMVKQIFKQEGVKGFYKGLSASYLGVTEGTIQWVLYERLKKLTQDVEGRGGAMEWVGMLSSAGTAKCVASLITYPHEVLRTRLRQPPLINPSSSSSSQSLQPRPKYTGLWQTLRLVIAEEGGRALYGGLSAHLMRVVPNAAVMYGIYEGVLRWA